MWQHQKQDKPNFAVIVLPALLDHLYMAYGINKHIQSK